MYAVIEDSLDTRTLLTKIIKVLTEEEVIEFETGEAFIRHQKIYNPRLKAVFIDIELPGMNGIEILEKIKSIPSMKEVKKVICSGTLNKDRIYAAVKAGAQEFIMKPFNKESIKKVFDK